MTRERAISFYEHEILAVLDGRKSEFRRVIKPQPVLIEDSNRYKWSKRDHLFIDGYRPWWSYAVGAKALPYRVGDVLWVQETFTLESNFNIGDYPPPFSDGRPLMRHESVDYGDYWEQPHYRATDPVPDLCYEDNEGPHCRWRSSTSMPRWATRIRLMVIDVWAECVQDITEAEAIAEGFQAESFYVSTPDEPPHYDGISAVDDFLGHFEIINAKRGYPVESNPWVWVVKFEVIEVKGK